MEPYSDMRTARGVFVPFTLLAAALSVAPARAAATACPAPASETCARAELGVPADAKRVVIVSQSSHLDWDWRHTFDEYFLGPLNDPFLLFRPGPVDTILSDAAQLMGSADGSGTRYYYSVAEMGFLARFVDAHPGVRDTLRGVAPSLRIVGGGITSPDDLLPSGEAFIRDYLVGKTWVDANLGLPLREAWLPDDFGHDAQLPIVLDAMGLTAVGFGRVLGADRTLQSVGLQPPSPGSLATKLLQEDGLDFEWQAADGSQVLAHWMPGGYCQGDIALGAASGAAAAAALDRVIAIDGPASHTPYIYIPIGCDFSRPRADLLDVVATWNAAHYAVTGVWAVAATFDDYMQLVAAHRAELPVRHFDPTPYWTGFYATRPLLKTMHLAATRALLAAETFGVIADGAAGGRVASWRNRVETRTAAIHAAWTTFVPANHHDFITGTALDAVYEGEQIPRLVAALTQAEGERDRAYGDVAARIRPRSAREGDTVVVFNPLGFARRALVETAGPAINGHAVSGPDQVSAEGRRLFVARLPSLGYATEDRARSAGGTIGRASLDVQADGGVIVLENAHLRATLRQDAAWGIVSLVDRRSGREVLRDGAVGNDFVQYADDGGLYRFGDEMEGCALEPMPAAAVGGPATVLERGPLRTRVVADVELGGRRFRKEYQLVAGEPFLRMLATGSAAQGTSVLVQFPLVKSVDALVHGTPYHWDQKEPERARPLTFEATHDFLVPELHRRPLAAIFHAAVPAWAVRRDGLLVGALWRNATQERCDFYGANGTDTHEVTVSYAIRVPTGIRDPRSGAQLREALAFETPALAIMANPGGRLPRRFSLASVRSREAMITTAKASTANPATLVLRVYQPSNARRTLRIRTGARRLFPRRLPLTLRPMTALEEPLGRTQAARLRMRGDADRFAFVTRHALTTIGIEAR